MSVAECILVVEEIWDSIAETPEEVPVTHAQRHELNRRLQAYRENPDAALTWEEVESLRNRNPNMWKGRFGQG
jgi:putative addiction module component (TIGR02574 family)